MSLGNDIKELKDLKLKMDRNARRRERRRLRKFQKTKKPRPPNSFILYRTYIQNTIINKTNKAPTNMRVASKKISELWKHEPNTIKTFWYQLAVKEKSKTSDKTVSEIVSSLDQPMSKVTSFSHLSTETTPNLDEQSYEESQSQITFIINENNIITQQSFEKSFQNVSSPISCINNNNNNSNKNHHHTTSHENVYLFSINDMTTPPPLTHPPGFYSGPSSSAHSPRSSHSSPSSSPSSYFSLPSSPPLLAMKPLSVFSNELSKNNNNNNKNIFLNSSFDNQNVLIDPCLVEATYDSSKYYVDGKSKEANFNSSPLIEFSGSEPEPLAPLFDFLDSNNVNVE